MYMTFEIIFPDYLRGVDVIGETSILVTNQAQSFKWVGYGLKIHVPKEALPADLEECRLLIKVGLSGQFGLPQYTSLSSAIYWLDSQPRCKFSQPIKSGNPTQCEEHSYITFEFCPCKVLPDGPPLSI